MQPGALVNTMHALDIAEALDQPFLEELELRDEVIHDKAGIDLLVDTDFASSTLLVDTSLADCRRHPGLILHFAAEEHGCGCHIVAQMPVLWPDPELVRIGFGETCHTVEQVHSERAKRRTTTGKPCDGYRHLAIGCACELPELDRAREDFASCHEIVRQIGFAAALRIGSSSDKDHDDVTGNGRVSLRASATSVMAPNTST